MNSFISWIGGKNNLKKEIHARFPDGFDKYIEVFGGAAWVLFYKDKHADIEIYNDYNNELVNLFKCVKYHYPELQRELSFMLNSRELFHDFKEQYNVRGLTDIQRAARFFMLIKTSYGSDRSSFGCVKKNVNKMINYLNKIQERLSTVIIENKDFEDLIKLHDKSKTFYYLDPPYFGTEKYYQVNFSIDDHVRLSQILRNLQGKFLLSYNDCDYIRELYKDFNIDEVERFHNLHSRYDDKTKQYKELIIMNY